MDIGTRCEATRVVHGKGTDDLHHPSATFKETFNGLIRWNLISTVTCDKYQTYVRTCSDLLLATAVIADNGCPASWHR